MTTSASYPDGSGWSVSRYLTPTTNEPRIHVWVNQNATLTPAHALELQAAIDFESQRCEEISTVPVDRSELFGHVYGGLSK